MAGNATIPTHFEVVKIEKQQEQGTLKGLAGAVPAGFMLAFEGRKRSKSLNMGNGHPTINRESL